MLNSDVICNITSTFFSYFSNVTTNALVDIVHEIIIIKKLLVLVYVDEKLTHLHCKPTDWLPHD